MTEVRTSVVCWLHLAARLVHAPAEYLPAVQWQNLVPSWPLRHLYPLPWLCYFQALSVGPASRVAPFDELSVALVIVSGALLLGEGLTLGACAPCSWAQAIDRPCKPV